MFRTLLELFVTILAVMVGRAILNSVMKGVVNASASAFQQQQQTQSAPNPQANPTAPKGNELHKDPVCGTYVSEGTSFRRNSSGQTFFYCSQACKDKHSAATR